MKNVIDSLLIVFGVVVLAVFFSLFMAFPVKWCWNYVMPYLFDFKTITWGQAWCLSFLANIFFKSFSTNYKKD